MSRFRPAGFRKWADRMAARLATRWWAACTAAEHRISRWVDRMAEAGLPDPRCASERGLAMGGGRPAERRFTVGGSGKSVARCHRTVLAYWKVESISLPQTVRLLLQFDSSREEARLCRGAAGRVVAACSAEPRRPLKSRANRR